MAIVTKRTVMSLFSDQNDLYCHQVRIVFEAKGIKAEKYDINKAAPTEELFSLNPYGTVPTLIDRDLVLFESRIIMEYLDERFPHPPLLPVYPVARAETRKMMHRIEHDWYTLYYQIVNSSDEAQKEEARSFLTESLISLDLLFSNKPFFMSDEFSLLDCVLAPLLWRLPMLGIILPSSAKGIFEYKQRIFTLDAFQASLSESEKQMRAA